VPNTTASQLRCQVQVFLPGDVNKNDTGRLFEKTSEAPNLTTIVNGFSVYGYLHHYQLTLGQFPIQPYIGYIYGMVLYVIGTKNIGDYNKQIQILQSAGFTELTGI
jgi:hypothetical protein